MNKKNPYVAGNWVRGKHFFGRKEFINELLENRKQTVWVAGTRRFGKTSLLKQIEYLTQSGVYAKSLIPLFWDLQGSQNEAGLRESLLESIEDCEEIFAAIGVDIEELESSDFFSVLRHVKRKAKEHHLCLLLLCDESEELLTIEKNSPEILPKLRRFFQSGGNLCTILTATRRLGELSKTNMPETSPFLHGFLPPAYLPPFADEDVRQLAQLGDFNESVTAEIIEKTNKHPYLVQLLCKRLFEVGDLQQVIEEIAMDDLIGHFFASDFQTLSNREKEILLHLSTRKELSIDEFQKQPAPGADSPVRELYELSQLGFVQQVNGQYKISNYFFATWLLREKEKLFSQSVLKRADRGAEITIDKMTSEVIPRIGDRLGQHELIEELGTGGMGVVFKAKDIQLRRDVALKILRPELMRDAEFRNRFLLEARSASAMNHPNIATVYQIGEELGVHFISMEFVDGENLSQWRSRNAEELDLQLAIAIQAAKGFAHAHRKRVVHRDIKPENILVTKDNVVKIMDFGLAKRLTPAQDSLTKSGTTLGTLRYMSPEQAAGLETDQRSDIFSFGVVLFELFTGDLPFSGDFEWSVLYSIMNEEPKPLLQANPDLPDDLERVIQKALQKDKTERYQAMEELMTTLEKITIN